MKEANVIHTVHLFPELDALLISLLKSLHAEDWHKQTIAPAWKVKDVAAHLLDVNIRSLSVFRDSFQGEKPEGINSYQELVVYLNKLNADWVQAMKRVSPEVLIELLEITGKEFCNLLATQDLYATSLFPVAWAGEHESKNWFHIAREYTERWHHQQQIRLAVGKEDELYQRRLYFPHLDTSMRALPFHYRDVVAEEGGVIKFSITTEGGGTWYLGYSNNQWQLLTESNTLPMCEVVIDGTIAWRLFTKGISKTAARDRISISGNITVGEKFLDMLAVMA
jgi:hypothetical protein